VAVLLFALFVLSRLAHTWAYATAQNLVVRATFFSVGSIVVFLMALWVLLATLF
jgi:glutathione S-transferase